MNGVFIVTNCTVSRTEEALVNVRDMTPGVTMNEALEEWNAMLNDCERRVTPRELYMGAGMQQIQRMLPQVGEDHVRIVTGGQGFIDLQQEIAPYDFTANPKEPFSIHNIVTKEPFLIPLWWTKINELRHGVAYPLAELLESEQTELVIIAVQKFFFRYLVDDLANAKPGYLRKLRILKTSTSQGYIPGRFRPYTINIPYGAFNASVGNRNDIPQRACLRFLELIEAEEIVTAIVDIQQEAINRAYGSPPSMSIQTRAQGAHQAFAPIEDDDLDESEEAAALAAMATIQPQINKHNGTDSTGLAEVDRTIRLFLTVLTKGNPEGTFTTNDFYNWVLAYYAAKKEEVPTWAQNKQRASQFIAQSYQRFGLTKFTVGSSSTGHYRIV